MDIKHKETKLNQDFSYSEIVNGVRTLSDPAIEWWNNQFAAHEFAPLDICNYLTAGLPGDRDNLLERIDYARNRTSIEVRGYDGLGEIFWAGRTLLFSSGELNLDVLKVREGYQSQGLGKALLKNAYRLARLLKLKRLRLTAMNVGSYAWAKAGFYASETSWLDHNCRGRIENYLRERRLHLGETLYHELLALALSDDPRSLWALAAYKSHIPLMKRPDTAVPIGVAILLESESSWQGTIELENGEIREKQIAIVRYYLGLEAYE